MHTARKLHRFPATKNIIYNNEMVHLANRVGKLTLKNYSRYHAREFST
jgi:hypothetical protein